MGARLSMVGPPLLTFKGVVLYEKEICWQKQQALITKAFICIKISYCRYEKTKLYLLVTREVKIGKKYQKFLI